MSAELSLEAHPVNNWSEGPSNVLTVDVIAARLRLDTHLSELVVSKHGRLKNIFLFRIKCSKTWLSGQVQMVVMVQLS